MGLQNKWRLVRPRPASLVETSLLSLTLICLPLFEAPKNVFCILFLATWLIHSWRAKSLGSNCVLNWPVLGLAAVLWIGPFFSDYENAIEVLDSAPRWTLLALFVVLAARLNYTRNQITIIWVALLFGGAAAVVESFWVWHLNGKEYPELRSVGHVNHSAMYLLVVLGCGLPAFLSKKRVLAWTGCLATLFVLFYLPPSKSGVALITTFAILVCFVGILVYPRFGWKSLLFYPLAAFTVSLAAAYLFGGGLWEEFTYRLMSSNPTNGRLQYAQIAIEVFDRHPLFGTGWFSFAEATSADVLREETAKSGNFVDFEYSGHPHGHNLWTTMLVERGVVGVALVTTLLFLYFRSFLPIALSYEQLGPFCRSVAVAAFLIAVSFAVAGLGNTTMMNEHGHAGMAFIAVAYGYLRGRGLISAN